MTTGAGAEGAEAGPEVEVEGGEGDAASSAAAAAAAAPPLPFATAAVFRSLIAMLRFELFACCCFQKKPGREGASLCEFACRFWFSGRRSVRVSDDGFLYASDAMQKKSSHLSNAVSEVFRNASRHSKCMDAEYNSRRSQQQQGCGKSGSIRKDRERE